MNKYMVSINGRNAKEVHAGRASIAVKRALDDMTEGSLRPVSQITVRYIGKLTYTYEVIADVPFDYGENGKGKKREIVAKGLASEEAALAEARKLKELNPDWEFIRSVRRVRS